MDVWGRDVDARATIARGETRVVALMRRDPSLKPGDLFQNQYAIRGVLGAGGHAFVYRAYDEVMAREVALKLIEISPESGADRTRRARREAQVLSRLNHPNVVGVHSAGVNDDGWIYIVMELLHGPSLRAVLQEFRTLSTAEALLIGAQIAEGVHAAHLLNTIHRDLKPENVILERGNRVRVIDFGVAKYELPDAQTTQRDIVPGTLLYMSPEQVQGVRVTPCADVFALATIVYEMIAGIRPAFIGLEVVDLNTVTYQLINTMPPRLDTFVPGVPSYVGRTLHHMLAKNPKDRLQVMAEAASLFRGHLERVLAEGGELVSVIRELAMLSAAPQPTGAAGPHEHTTRRGEDAPLQVADGLTKPVTYPAALALAAQPTLTTAQLQLQAQPAAPLVSDHQSASGLPSSPTLTVPSAPPPPGLAPAQRIAQAAAPRDASAGAPLVERVSAPLVPSLNQTLPFGEPSRTIDGVRRALAEPTPPPFDVRAPEEARPATPTSPGYTTAISSESSSSSQRPLAGAQWPFAGVSTHPLFGRVLSAGLLVGTALGVAAGFTALSLRHGPRNPEGSLRPQAAVAQSSVQVAAVSEPVSAITASAPAEAPSATSVSTASTSPAPVETGKPQPRADAAEKVARAPSKALAVSASATRASVPLPRGAATGGAANVPNAPLVATRPQAKALPRPAPPEDWMPSSGLSDVPSEKRSSLVNGGQRKKELLIKSKPPKPLFGAENLQ